MQNIGLNSLHLAQSLTKPGRIHRQGLPLASRRASTATMSSLNIQDELDSQTMTLPDGRTLGYAEYGNPKGYPLMFFHGYPSSRLEASVVNGLARKRGIRILSPERPGFGLSTFKSNRRVMDWPADVRAFAEHLGLQKFALLGGSGGGPFALACAKEMPEMLSAVGLMASGGAWDKAGNQDVLWYAWLYQRGATYCPSLLKILSDGFVGALRWSAGTNMVKTWLDKTFETLKQQAAEKRAKEGKESDPFEEVMSRPLEEQRERAIREVLEGFAQGTAATVQEALLQTENWGFEFEDITYNKVQMWHGTEDKNAPIRMIRYMAERMPHAELKEYEGENHYQLTEHMEEIIDELVTPEMIEKWNKEQ